MLQTIEKKKYKSILLYLLSYFLNAGISFVIVFILTHYLTVEEFGIINLYSVTLVLISPFISCGTLNTISVEYFRKEEREFKTFFSHAIGIGLINTCFLTILCICFSGVLLSALKVNHWFIWVLPLTAFFIFIYEVILTIIRNKNFSLLFFSFSLGKTIVEAAITLFLILFIHLKWEGRLSGMLGSVLIAGVFTIWLLHSWKFKFQIRGWDQKKVVLALSAPFIIERLAAFVLTSSDRYFIGLFSGIKDVGFYSVGSQIAAIANLTILSLNNFFYPYIFNNLKKEESDKGASVRTGIAYYLLASVATIVIILLAIPLIFKLFISSEFQSGIYYAYLLTISFLPWAFYQALLIILLFLQRNNYIMRVAVAGMVFSLLSNYFMIQWYGPVGAAITLMFVYTLMAILVFIQVFKTKRTALPFFK